MKSSRPPLLMILCAAGLIGCFFNMFIVLSPAARNIGNWYPSYLSLSTVYVVVCLGGLGMMRKWAVLAYSFYALLNQLVYLSLGTWNGFVLILPTAITLAGCIYYRRMD